MPGIRQRAIEIEHDQIHRSFHRQRLKMKSNLKSTQERVSLPQTAELL
jgi:hypothetical protein